MSEKENAIFKISKRVKLISSLLCHVAHGTGHRMCCNIRSLVCDPVPADLHATQHKFPVRPLRLAQRRVTLVSRSVHPA